MNIFPVKGIYPMCKVTFFAVHCQVVLKNIYICHIWRNQKTQYLHHGLTD